jgi:prolyl oligopeptidase
LKDLSIDGAEEIIPEKVHLLKSVSSAGKQLFANYLEKASSHIYRMNYDGSDPREIELPGVGSAGGFSGKKADSVVFYTYTSFVRPPTIYKYNISSGNSSIFFETPLNFNPDEFVEKQVTYKSKDGTEVTMFVVHKKDLDLDGENPTYLYGYGGFNISLTPSFSSSRIILLENGGVFAMPNLRGGGEYGEDWHKAGMLLKKQNVFDDFIAAAEYLIDSNYTSSSKMGIAGGSNGGLLVGACMTQRPDLFAVAFPAVGVLDMLRFHKFTIGYAWVPEYGSSEDPKHFENLLSYSPLHNLVDSTSYPATMITTADHDDRVVPAHSFKFAARLQEAHEGVDPVLIRIETKAGHGAGKPTSKIIEEQADKWSFFFYNTETPVEYEVDQTKGE